MNLIWFLTIITAVLGVLGEFGQFPFGSTNSISLIDLGSVGTVVFLAIWQIGICHKLVIPKLFWWIIGFEIVGLTGLLKMGQFDGLVYLLRFGIYSLWIWIGYSLAKSKTGGILEWINLIVVLGVLIMFGGIVQMIWLPDLKVLGIFGYDPHYQRMTGLFLDPNFYGLIMAICCVVALEKYRRNKDNLAAFLSGIYGVGVILSLSRSAYLTLSGMLVVWGWQRSKKWTVIMMSLGLLMMVMIPRVNSRIVGIVQPDQSALERVESWQKGLKLWQLSPIVGIGFDNIRVVSQQQNLYKLISADGGNSGAGIDSSLLVVLATTGVLGTICYGFFWGIVWSKSWRSEQKRIFAIVLLGVVVDSWFINSWFWPLTMMWLYLGAGMVLAKD